MNIEDEFSISVVETLPLTTATRPHEESAGSVYLDGALAWAMRTHSYHSQWVALQRSNWMEGSPSLHNPCRWHSPVRQSAGETFSKHSSATTSNQTATQMIAAWESHASRSPASSSVVVYAEVERFWYKRTDMKDSRADGMKPV